MLEIKDKQELKIKNIISYRGKINHEELENIGKDMENYIQNSGAKSVGRLITATYSSEGNIIDIEILIPIDIKIESTDKYIFKEQLQIVNAVVASYKGHPKELYKAIDELNHYIIKNNLTPITVGYNVTKKLDVIDPRNAEIEIYVGINPNIL